MPSLRDEILVDLYAGLFYLLNPYEFYRGGLQYNTNNFYKTVERLEKKGLLKKSRKEKKIYLQLTDQGKKVVRNHQRAGSRPTRSWDGKWRVVIFDIPERKADERRYFRNYLKTLGFRKVQRSTWLTPYNFQKLIDHFSLKMKISDYIYQMTVEQFRGLSNVAISQTFWPIKRINTEYHTLQKEYSSRFAQLQQNKGNLTASIAIFRKQLLLSLIWDYQAIAARDPHLPEEVLPEKWGRKSILAFIDQVQKLVNPDPEIGIIDTSIIAGR